MTHVNWGILGAARFARQHMGPAIHAATGGRLAGLATSDATKAQSFLDFAPDCRVFDSYDALLADPGIDAVYIPLPNHLHVEWATKAAQAGKHVLCEKPIALDTAEIDTLIALRDSTGMLIAEAFMIVHHPQWHKARDLVREGALGTLHRVEAAFSFYNNDPVNIRNRPETGGGALRDIGVYIFGGTRFVTGEEPSEMLSVDVDWENDVDTRVHVTARFPSFHYSGMVSTRLALFQDVTFHGSEAVMKLSAPFNAGSYGQADVTLLRAPNHVQIWRFPDVQQYVLQVEAFNAAVQGGVDYPCPLEFVRGTQEMIDRVFDAAKA